MSVLLKELVSASLLGQYESLRLKAKSELRTSIEPLPFAAASLPVHVGSDLEAGAYRKLSVYEIKVVNRLFRTTMTSIARRLLQAHPELADEVLGHAAIKDHLTIGSLKRLSRGDQATKAMRLLLSDSYLGLEYQKRNLFEWDNGDVQGALIVAYGWQKVIKKKRAFLQSVSQNRKAARVVLENALSSHSTNPFLQLIDHHLHLAWDSDARVHQFNSVAKLESLSGIQAAQDREQALKLLSLSSLAYAGHRFRQPERALNASEQIQSILPPQPNLRLIEAWSQVRGGDQATARQMAVTLLNDSNPLIKAGAAQILETLGDTQIPLQVYATLAPDLRPKSLLGAIRVARLT